MLPVSLFSVYICTMHVKDPLSTVRAWSSSHSIGVAAIVEAEGFAEAFSSIARAELT